MFALARSHAVSERHAQSRKVLAATCGHVQIVVLTASWRLRTTLFSHLHLPAWVQHGYVLFPGSHEGSQKTWFLATTLTSQSCCRGKSLRCQKSCFFDDVPVVFRNVVA